MLRCLRSIKECSALLVEILHTKTQEQLGNCFYILMYKGEVS